MNPFKSSKRKARLDKNHYTTRSGTNIKINKSLSSKSRARKDARSRAKAAYLATLPKGRVKRFFARLHPKRLYRYWFSRQGAIMALKIIGIGIVASFLLVIGLFAYFRKDLPNLKDDISGKNIGGSIRYYDRTNTVLLWEDYDAVKRIPVKSDQINENIKMATVAIEDKDFFEHGGFDVRGIMRAGVNNITGSSGGQQGGSTITQQLVKLTQNWTEDQTYTRKVKELILAVELERSYTKDEILTGYLNTAPYGGIEYGVEAASQGYFAKPASKLTLDEATFLAAIPKSPRYYSPYSADFDKESFTGRQHYILNQMVEQGMITAAESDAAKEVNVVAKVKQRKPKYDNIRAPWFVLAAKKQLEDRVGAETAQRGGWSVKTSLDLGLQKIAEEQVNNGIGQIRAQGGDTAAFAASDVETGQMVALVGGSDFNNKEFGKINYATRPLPPGSSFKPYDYLALIEHNNNFGAGSVLYDTKGALEGYPCTNKTLPPPRGQGNCLYDYDFRFPGPMTLRYALGGSRNIPAVKAMLITGVDKTIDTAEKLGLKSGYKCYKSETDDISQATASDEQQCYGSSAIGDGAYLHLDEHVHAYGTISRNGVKVDQTYILEINDAGNRPVFKWEASKGEQVVRPESAYIVADMMEDPNASYFPAGRKPHRYNGWKFAMKTGTTNDAKDGWMMGFSAKYAAGVWVGYHTGQREMSGTMEAMTQPIWQGWMQRAHDGKKVVERKKPEGVKTQAAYVVRANPGLGAVVPSAATDIFPSWYQQPNKTTSSNKTIDIVSNKLSTNCTPERARKKVNDRDASSFSGDTFVDGGAGSANTAEKDDIHKCGDDKPSITVTANCSGGSCTFVATVTQGTHPINSSRFPGTVTFTLDGQSVRTASVKNSPATVQFTTTGTGSKKISVSVVDSVLYEASDSATANFGSGATGPSISSAKVTGVNVNITWSGGTNPITIRTKDGDTLCVNETDGSCTAPAGDAPVGTKIYATDADGKKSGEFTVN
jgi:membrane peptidoglycan carboxypeptidase